MADMDETIQRACGIDIDSLKLWSTVLVVSQNGKRTMKTREFDNSVTGIEQLIEWLKKKRVTHVAFESTGNYWQMLYSFLEESFTVLVANPRQVKQLKGKKTDPNDSKRLAELLQLGVIQPSYIPPKEIRELRDITRQYQNLVHDMVRTKNRVTKTLWHAGITLDQHMSDIFGVSGQLIIGNLIDGVPGTEAAQLAKGRLRPKIPLLEQAMRFPLSDHYRDILSRYWREFLFLQDEIADIDRMIDERMVPYQADVRVLRTLPGVAKKVARGIISEIGSASEFSAFPTAKNLASWAKICPGNNSSGGKRKSGRNSKGNKYIRSYLVEAAWAAVRTRGSAFRDIYYRLKGRVGSNKAIVAVAHKLLRVIYAMMTSGVPYAEAYELQRRPKLKQYLIHENLKDFDNEALVDELLRRGADQVIWKWETAQEIPAV